MNIRSFSSSLSEWGQVGGRKGIRMACLPCHNGKARFNFCPPFPCRFISLFIPHHCSVCGPPFNRFNTNLVTLPLDFCPGGSGSGNFIIEWIAEWVVWPFAKRRPRVWKLKNGQKLVLHIVVRWETWPHIDSILPLLQYTHGAHFTSSAKGSLKSKVNSTEIENHPVLYVNKEATEVNEQLPSLENAVNSILLQPAHPHSNGDRRRLAMCGLCGCKGISQSDKERPITYKSEW